MAPRPYNQSTSDDCFQNLVLHGLTWVLGVNQNLECSCRLAECSKCLAAARYRNTLIWHAMTMAAAMAIKCSKYLQVIESDVVLY